VLGSEAHGLSPAVLDRLDTPVSLPGAPHRPSAESLNVAVAGGILVYEWMGE
jgi:TrmH family RNA methyltransferase